MHKQNVTNSDKREVKRVDIYEEFCIWSAMPPSERIKLGIETQEQFVEFYKIGINTPTAWKRRNDYRLRVTSLRTEWAFSKTSAVLESIYRTAIKGSAQSQKLWLQYIHGFGDKREIPDANKPSLHVDDLLFLIGMLPKELQEKHYDHMRELLDDSARHKHELEKSEEWDQVVDKDWAPPFTLESVTEEYLNEQEEKKKEVISRVNTPSRYPTSMCSDCFLNRVSSDNSRSVSGW